MLLGAATAANGPPKALEANTPATRFTFGVLTVFLIPALLVGASVIVFSVNLSMDFSTIDTVVPTVVLAVGILPAHSVASRLWLHHFRYGPLEWAWRIATWRTLVPIRRTPADQPVAPESAARTSS